MYDDNPYSARAWLLDEIARDFKTGGSYSVSASKSTNAAFLKWTGHTFGSLQTKWKTKPAYTTCADFLFHTNRMLCDKNSVRAGARFGFVPFGLDQCGANGFGWHTIGDDGPYSGDYFQQGSDGSTTHVGIIAEINGTMATYLAGGGGTPGSSQSITMVQGEWPPENLLGWLDIDEYYNP